MASLIDRLAKLEERLGRPDPMRVINVDEHADRDEALENYRQRTGYRGIVVVLDEQDMAL